MIEAVLRSAPTGLLSFQRNHRGQPRPLRSVSALQLEHAPLHLAVEHPEDAAGVIPVDARDIGDVDELLLIAHRSNGPVLLKAGSVPLAHSPIHPSDGRLWLAEALRDRFGKAAMGYDIHYAQLCHAT